MDQTDDLKLIKKYYGEKMAHLCRSMFPTILETPGLLFKALSETFAPSKTLYDSIFGYEYMFKDIIVDKIGIQTVSKEKEGTKTPAQLLEEAGYVLYECNSESDIQSFKKYYASGEELCTFRGGRLDRCFVFFAVKKDVDQIKRENFKNPRREDDYGVSVISIQFTRDPSNTLSIKNRYNHTVNNPDATFSNNLENIIPGLTEAFNREYGLHINSSKGPVMIPGFVLANDGKYYQYNYEINNVYYCPDNIVIDNFEVKKYDKEKYIISDYFVIDLVNKRIELYDHNISDSFIDTVRNITNIEVIADKQTNKKNVIINNGELVITLNKKNQMISITDNRTIEFSQGYLNLNKYLESINAPNVETIRDYCLGANLVLKKASLPKVKTIGDVFLMANNGVEQLSFPLLEEIGDYFLANNTSLFSLELPNVKKIGNNFLTHSNLLDLELPNVEEIASNFMSGDRGLLRIILPKLKHIGYNFLQYNQELKSIDLPNVETIAGNFMVCNEGIKNIELPKVKEIGDWFLGYSKVETVSLPNVEKVGGDFLSHALFLKTCYLPYLKYIGQHFLEKPQIKSIDLPSAVSIGFMFLADNYALKDLNLPNLADTRDLYYVFKNNPKAKIILSSPQEQKQDEGHISIFDPVDDDEDYGRGGR